MHSTGYAIWPWESHFQTCCELELACLLEKLEPRFQASCPQVCLLGIADKGENDPSKVCIIPENSFIEPSLVAGVGQLAQELERRRLRKIMPRASHAVDAF